MVISSADYDLNGVDSISFDPSVDADVFKQAVSDILDYTRNLEIAKQPKVSLRGLSTELLTEGLRLCFGRLDIANPCILLNLYNTVKRYNTLDNSFFESEEVWFTSIEQFLDIKVGLRSEIQDFTNKMAYWYLSCIYSMHKVEYTMLEYHEPMPDIYRNFMLTSDLYTMSALVAKADNIQTKDLMLVDNAYAYVTELALRSNIAAKLFEAL